MTSFTDTNCGQSGESDGSTLVCSIAPASVAAEARKHCIVGIAQNAGHSIVPGTARNCWILIWQCFADFVFISTLSVGEASLELFGGMIAIDNLFRHEILHVCSKLKANFAIPIAFSDAIPSNHATYTPCFQCFVRAKFFGPPPDCSDQFSRFKTVPFVFVACIDHTRLCAVCRLGEFTVSNSRSCCGDFYWCY